MCSCTQQTVPYKTGTQTTTFSYLICASYLEHLRPNLSDLTQEKLYSEKTYKTSDHLLKKHCKIKFKMAEVKREEHLGRMALKVILTENSEKKFLCKSNLKERIKN